MRRFPKDFENSEFELYAEVKDNDLSILIDSEFKSLSIFSLIYWGSIFSISVCLIYIIRQNILTQDVSNVLVECALGVLIGVASIPMHEYLHGVYLKIIGAIDVRFSFDLRKLKFTTDSHHFVFSMTDYILFVLFPFLIITGSNVFILIAFGEYRMYLLCFLLIHTTLCTGDFALAGYTYRIRNKSVQIYYDRYLKKTVFYTLNAK